MGLDHGAPTDGFAAARQDAAGRTPSGDRDLEARLDELLREPTVQLLMERDGVERDVLVRTVRLVRRRIEEARRHSPGSGS